MPKSALGTHNEMEEPPGIGITPKWSILKYLEQTGNEYYKCYRTSKVCLDSESYSGFAYDDKEATSGNGSKYAEQNSKDIITLKRDNEIGKIFSYFLDGSRHVYKVDDMAIGSNKKIYPVLAGQIVVGCCKRNNSERGTFSANGLTRKLVMAVPTSFDYDCGGENFLRNKVDGVNQNLSQNPFIKESGIKLDKILLYKTDQRSEDERDSYKSRGTSVIQTEMTNAEQEMVAGLCRQNKLNGSNYMIKDGSLEYKDMCGQPIAKRNYRHVVGVSKNFNPELLLQLDKHIPSTIAHLLPYQRTRAFRYTSPLNNVQYAVWYLRLRNNPARATCVSDVVKCEMIIINDDDFIDSETIDMVSTNLINEAYPVCYGSDTRWENHLYPVYLTELYCKSKFYNQDIIMKLF